MLVREGFPEEPLPKWDLDASRLSRSYEAILGKGKILTWDLKYLSG